MRCEHRNANNNFSSLSTEVVFLFIFGRPRFRVCVCVLSHCFSPYFFDEIVAVFVSFIFVRSFGGDCRRFGCRRHSQPNSLHSLRIYDSVYCRTFRFSLKHLKMFNLDESFVVCRMLNRLLVQFCACFSLCLFWLRRTFRHAPNLLTYGGKSCVTIRSLRITFIHQKSTTSACFEQVQC